MKRIAAVGQVIMCRLCTEKDWQTQWKKCVLLRYGADGWENDGTGARLITDRKK